MKVNSLHQFSLLLLPVLIGCLMAGCVGTSDFLTSSLLPQTQSHVKIKMGHDSNYVIQVYLINLIRVNHLQPAKESYVVWMVSDRGITKNIGVITYSPTLFSKSIKSTFRPASSLKPARIYITAEDDPGVQISNTEIVFSTSKFRE